jgi:hypothetical protein
MWGFETEELNVWVPGADRLTALDRRVRVQWQKAGPMLLRTICNWENSRLEQGLFSQMLYKK